MLLLADSERNRTHKLCAVCRAPATAFCGRCKTTPYCSAACQRSQWPLHKPYCATPIARPPGAEAELNKLLAAAAASPSLPSDWDAPQPFILLRAVSWSSFVAIFDSVVGVSAGHAIDGSWSPEELSRFEIRVPSLHTVSGFSHEDAVALRSWSDDTFDASLSPNGPGGHLLMQPNCRGGVLVQKYDSATGRALHVSRREIFEICAARDVLGGFGVVTERISRENARRKEALAYMRAMGMQVL